MKFNPALDMDTFAGALLRTTLGKMKEQEVKKILATTDPLHGLDLELTVLLNGFELPFDHFITMLEKEHTAMVVEKAEGIMKDSINNLFDQLADAVNQVIIGFRAEATKKLGYNPWGSNDHSKES